MQMPETYPILNVKMEIAKNTVTNVTNVTRLTYSDLRCNLFVTFVTFNILLTFVLLKTLQTLHQRYKKRYTLLI